MSETFTQSACQTMQRANHEAQRLSHEYIGTEHILLGLIKTDESTALTILNKMGVNPCDINTTLKKIVVEGPNTVMMSKLPQTPRAKQVIEFALEESRALNRNYVGTEHLLLGLLRDEDSIAAQVLTKLGVKIADVRNHAKNVVHSIDQETIGNILSAAIIQQMKEAAGATHLSDSVFLQWFRSTMLQLKQIKALADVYNPPQPQPTNPKSLQDKPH